MAALTPESRLNRSVSLAIWTGALTLLVLPAVAMRFTAEVNWTVRDFVLWAFMLAGAGGGYELLARRAPNWAYRAAAVVALGTGFLLAWVSLAVGIIGSERNPANGMYAGVLAVTVGGACLARLRSTGMARTMLAAATAQLLVAAAALVTNAGADGARWPVDLLGATGVLTALWLTAAWLFYRAAR